MKSVCDHEMSLSRTIFSSCFKGITTEMEKWGGGGVWRSMQSQRKLSLWGGKSCPFVALFYRHHVTDYALDSLQM